MRWEVLGKGRGSEEEEEEGIRWLFFIIPLPGAGKHDSPAQAGQYCIRCIVFTEITHSYEQQ